MQTTVVRLRDLDGEAYDVIFMQELMNFKNPELGVDGDDIDAALILRDEGRFGLLGMLHDRRIRVIGPVDELSMFSELEFESVDD